jgi:hypothetical protein
MKKIKQIVKYSSSLLFFFFLFSVPKTLAQVTIDLNFDFGDGGDGGGAGWNPDAYDGTELPGGTISGIIENVVLWALGIFGFIGVIGFVISGILYLTAAGSDEQIKKAKSAMTWSIIGVIVGLVGVVAIKAADALLRGDATI